MSTMRTHLQRFMPEMAMAPHDLDYDSRFSHLHQGETGLELVTDTSPLMSSYTPLPGGGVTMLLDKYTEAARDELIDACKYLNWATEARELGRNDIAIAFEIIAADERNHKEIIMAILRWPTKPR